MRVDFEALSRTRLKSMSQAGEEVLDAFRALGKAGANPVAQVLAHQGNFFELDHYPKGDVYDAETASQYYYHAHRGQTGEHGHFRTFIRAKSVASGIQPLAVPTAAKRPRGKAAICHLIAISMNRAGLPIGLLTTNQWVTDGLVALSLPGGATMTLTGGLLFGCFGGAIAAVVGATTGATIVVLFARTAMGDILASKAGLFLGKLRDGFRENALSHVLFLRLVPAFPFWLVNLAPAVLGVPLRLYVLGTLLGIIPGTLAIASAGAGLDAVITAAKADQAAFMAAHGSAVCPLSIKLGALLNAQLVAALVLLGFVALLPVVVQRRSRDEDM